MAYIIFFKAKEILKSMKKSTKHKNKPPTEDGYHIAGTETASNLYTRPLWWMLQQPGVSSSSADSHQRSVIMEESEAMRERSSQFELNRSTSLV